jgi:hypothetical protein
MTAVDHRRPTARDTVAAEWTKLAGLPRNRRTAAGAVALALLVAALFCLTFGATTGVPLAEQPVFDVLTAGLLGVDAAALVLAVLAAAGAGGEYATGMIRTTFTATPSRGRVLVARALVAAAASWAVSLAAAVGAALVSLLVLWLSGLPAWDATEPAVWRVVLGASLMGPFYALAAVALADLTRSTGGGVAGVVALLVAPTVAGWLPGGQAVVPFLPGEAVHVLAGITGPGQGHASPWSALLVLAVWAVALLLPALGANRRRDT